MSDKKPDNTLKYNPANIEDEANQRTLLQEVRHHSGTSSPERLENLTPSQIREQIAGEDCNEIQAHRPDWERIRASAQKSLTSQQRDNSVSYESDSEDVSI